ncbi:MAG: MotA/TolQ/ExbB proton channel family protein [Prevotellaceae bacterium]|jgi:biopolymer transport protein ExbB|nr:MotA/TolQ/ExbB proton channel family protein [Prevotellaceae bacterium]MDY3856028.1 MotA/TolQ/ExbB proton channel family protein [Bacteroidaceae bacterium]
METKETKATVNNVSKKPVAAKKKSQGFTGIKSAWIILVICLVLAIVVYQFVLGSPSNFAGGDRSGKALNMLGTVYKGGFVVPIIWTMLFADLALTFERFLALKTAFGKMSLDKFVKQTKDCLQKNDLDGVLKVCDKQGGSVANVINATIVKYREVEADNTLTKEQKVLSLQKTLDEATALEMPTLQMNLPILAVIVTLGVLTGLFGTVLGMIRSFSALSAGGGGDSAALSQGISEALVNTASGIATSALAVIFYNYFTNRIDHLTYGLDEVGFTVVATFNATH